MHLPDGGNLFPRFLLPTVSVIAL